MIDEIITHKPRLVVLNKADMADDRLTKQWIAYFKEKAIWQFQLTRKLDKV